MLNSVKLIGRLTKDPELTYTQNGVATVRFILAVNKRSARNQQNQNQQEPQADFIPCTAWRKTAENLANFQRKGSLILVEGILRTSSYEGQEGKRVFHMDVTADSIQFLESKQQQTGGQSNTYGQPQHQNAPGNFPPPPTNVDPRYPQNFPNQQGYQHNQHHYPQDPFGNPPYR